MSKINYFDRIDWTEESITHISRHNVVPEEVEEGIFDDNPHLRLANVVTTELSPRTIVYCQTAAGRYLFVVITPFTHRSVRVVTARDMDKSEIAYYKKRRR